MKLQAVTPALAIVALLASVTPVVAAAPTSISSWTWTTVAAAGGNPAVRIAPDGTTRVVYGGPDGLWYARQVATGWTRTRIVPVTPFDPADLELDAAGKAHVVYDTADAGLWYATDRWGAWRRYHITTGECDGHPDLAVQADGEAEVLFHRATYDEDWGCDNPTALMRATNRRGYWQTFTLTHPSAGGADVFPSVALGADGAIHVAFRRNYATTDGIMYMTNATGRWFTRALTTVASDRDPRLVIAPDGSIDVGFVGTSPAPGGFGLVSNRTGTWVVRRNLVKAPIPDERLRMAVDGDGAVHAAWCAGGPLTWVTEHDGAWVAEQAATWCERTAIAVGPEGRPRLGLAYGPLRLLTFAASWRRTTLGSTDYAYGPSLAGDPTGHHHAVWRSSAADLLKYATDASGSWVVQGIPGSSDAVQPNVAADAAGKAHVAVAWNDPSTSGYEGIREFTNATGSWVHSTVSTVSELPTSVAIGPDGSTWILASSDLGLHLYHRAGGIWVQVALPSWAATSHAGSLVVDGSGRIHLAMYRSAPTAGIAYATNKTGTWSSRVFTDGSPAQPALVLDRTRDAHVAYAAGDRVRYATNDSGSWVVATAYRYTDPDRLPYISDPRLGVDASGRPWLSVAETPGVVVIHRVSSGWLTEALAVGESLGVAFTVVGDTTALLRLRDGGPVEIMECTR